MSSSHGITGRQNDQKFMLNDNEINKGVSSYLFNKQLLIIRIPSSERVKEKKHANLLPILNLQAIKRTTD